MTNKLLLLLGLSTSIAQISEAAKQPNVILIFADDFGYGDLACYGNKLNRTPSFDRLAKEGVRLTDFYVGSSVSSPSRSALMTGSYPKRVSMHVNADPVPLMGKTRQVLFPISMKGLNPSEYTIAELMRDNGYSTACIGKWHLGDQLQFLPTRQGFEYFYGLPYSHDMGKSYCPLPLMEQEKVIEAPVGSDSLTIKLTVKAQEFIVKNKKNPFFLYLPHCMTHKPLNASPRFKGKSANGIYGDAVEELDWSIGEILKTLKEQGLDDNTLVIFASDNGAARGAGGTNLPLRDWKGSTYEGGFRVPCIMRYPHVIPANQTCSEITTSMDFLPTIASFCHLKFNPQTKIDGIDISKIVEGKNKFEGDRVFYYYQRNQLQAIRCGKWKYHMALEQRIVSAGSELKRPSEAQLFDLSTDISEKHNVLSQHPSVEKRMKELIDEARKDLGDWKYEGENVRPAGFIDEPFGRYLQK